MKRMLLAAAGPIAAIALSATVAQAQTWDGHHRSGALAGVPDTGARTQAFGRSCGDGRCRLGRSGDVVPVEWYGGEWARWNNQNWDSTSYNDWWHEEPWRAYPAWMHRNQDCTRHWYAGDTLRC